MDVNRFNKLALIFEVKQWRKLAFYFFSKDKLVNPQIAENQQKAARQLVNLNNVWGIDRVRILKLVLIVRYFPWKCTERLSLLLNYENTPLQTPIDNKHKFKFFLFELFNL